MEVSYEAQIVRGYINRDGINFHDDGNCKRPDHGALHGKT
jgi:hypothetical protein